MRATLYKIHALIRKLTRILAAMMENIRNQEKRNSRIAYDHQNQRMAKAQDDDRKRRDAHKKQMYDRLAFLRRSCRCRFICLGLSLVLVRGTLIYFFFDRITRSLRRINVPRRSIAKVITQQVANCNQLLADHIGFKLSTYLFLFSLLFSSDE